ncbi:DNA-methyltransferase [Caldisericum sp.]|uniref:DNA-methyltransferase n=1 Tax=Caldisericum sp. TaxID=2499687 RepID=UPI003D0F0B43
MSWKDLFPKENRYYETEHGILYHMDSIPFMENIPENTFDLILTDPPYNIDQKQIIKSKVYSKTFDLSIGEWDRKWETWEDYFQWLKNIFELFGKIAKPNSWIYSWLGRDGASFITINAEKLGMKIKNHLFWVKPNGRPNVLRVNWNSSVEIIVVLINKPTKNKDLFVNLLPAKEMHNFFIAANSSSYGKENYPHPTQKPLFIHKKIIYLHSNPEEHIIFDPFIGSGTVAVACEEMQRRWIGIEKEEKYCEIVKKRLQKCNNKKEIFEQPRVYELQQTIFEKR